MHTLLIGLMMMAAAGVEKPEAPKINMELQRDYFQAYLLFVSAQQNLNNAAQAMKVIEDKMQSHCGDTFVLNKTLERQRREQTASVPECVYTVAPTTITPGKPEMKAPEGKKEGK